MMDKKPHVKPYLYGMLAGFGAISLSIIFFFLIYRFDGFGDAISTLTGILMPFIYGAVIATCSSLCATPSRAFCAGSSRKRCMVWSMCCPLR